MSSVTGAFKTLKEKVGGKRDTIKIKTGSGLNGLAERFFNDEGEPMSKNQRRKQDKEDEKREKRRTQEDKEEELEHHRQEEDELAAQKETPEQRARYGMLSPNYSQNGERANFNQHIRWKAGDDLSFRARVHTTRAKSARLLFCIFRQRSETLQGVIEVTDRMFTEHMLRWIGRITPESIVLVTGTLQEPAAEITGTTINDLELNITSFHVVSQASGHVPFDVYSAEKLRTIAEQESDEEAEAHLSLVSDRVRLSHRIMDLRGSTAQAIFRINSGICNIFRSHLDSLGFVEIHTPKLQGGATESGASVFSVQYFGRPAFLAQSPQLAKQMCIAADFERVYEIGPVFRAENSNTHRHLTEYTGLDIEMTFEKDYHEVMNVIDGTLKTIFKGVHDRFGKEIECVKREYPHEPLVWLEQTLILPFKEGIKLLKESGWTEDSESEDLSTRGEIRLGEIVKDKYHTDYYILDKFPTSARPFYTMLSPEDPAYTNSFDIFLRGQEILTGGQRIHDLTMLEKRMGDLGVRPEAMEDYMDGFRWGAALHGGGGLGLERVVMLLLNLGDVRNASLFPRDPKSLPKISMGDMLRHPDASTLEPPWRKRRPEATADEMQPLEKLIANYGDATNTAWLDQKYQIWRCDENGAAVGYVVQGSFVIIVGDPLCDASQYLRTTQSFLRFVKKKIKQKPIWMLVNSDMERILGDKLGWRTMTCVGEARVDPAVDPAHEDANVARKIRHAEKEGVEVTEITPGQPVPDDIRKECDQRMQDWLNARSGKQVHLTELNPWPDHEHRRYIYARDKGGRICALAVLAQLAPKYGFQLKWALDFPDAPSGTIELIVSRALQSAKDAGATSVTFGHTPASQFRSGSNMSGLRTKALAHSYGAIAYSMKLLQKSDFKEKLGAEQDPAYICYPNGGLGPSGVKAILTFIGDEDDK